MGMSLEEALKILEDYSFELHHLNGANYTDFNEAIDRAILSMKKELKGENKCETNIIKSKKAQTTAI